MIQIFYLVKQLLIRTLENIKTLHEELKDMKDAGKGISFYSFRKTFRTMLSLKNDLAEYYMGHKLGNDAKTTYIQVNSLDNKLFVEEYAQPVIEMLDKFVFFNEEELKMLSDEDKKKSKDKVDFLASKIGKGASLQDAFIDHAIREYKELVKNVENPSETKGYFDRI